MESLIKQQILADLGGDPKMRIFNNPVGSGWVGKLPDRLRRLRFGLCPGSADLIGLRSVVVTPDLVGKRVAIFVALEVKDKTSARANQRAFREMVADLGGIAAVVRSPIEARAAVFDRPIGRHEEEFDVSRSKKQARAAQRQADRRNIRAKNRTKPAVPAAHAEREGD